MITLTPRGRKLLARVAKVIVRKPKEFDMVDWIVTARNTHNPANCNTVACIAGHVVLQAGIPEPSKETDAWYRMPSGLSNAVKNIYQRLRVKSYARRVSVAALAAELLTSRDTTSTDPLFYANEWPLEFRKPYYAATSVEERAEIAAKRIHHLLETGE